MFLLSTERELPHLFNDNKKMRDNCFLIAVILEKAKIFSHFIKKISKNSNFFIFLAI